MQFTSAILITMSLLAIGITAAPVNSDAPALAPKSYGVIMKRSPVPVASSTKKSSGRRSSQDSTTPLLSGQTVPNYGTTETDAQRAARIAREESARRAAEAAAKRERDQAEQANRSAGL